MRIHSLLALPLLLCVVVGASAGATTACGGDDNICNCPTSATPQVLVSPPCGELSQPTMTLSGVCVGTQTEVGGELAFGSLQVGSCGVTLSYANGTTFSASVEFTGEPLPCGSDPTGCGELIKASGLPADSTYSIYSVLAIGPQCGDAGGGDAGGGDGGAPDTGGGAGGTDGG